jgi:GT2 family glycosyltransferase
MTRRPRSVAPFEGAILGHRDGVVFGWARARDGGTVVVELWGDGEPVALAACNLRLPDGTGCPVDKRRFGFMARVGKERLQSLGRVTARVANHDFMLAGAVEIAALDAPVSPPMAGVYDRDGLRIYGWVLPDPVSGHVPTVLALLDGRCIAEAPANRRDPQLVALGGPGDASGFDLTLPLALADGREHQITLCTSHGVELPGSPLRVCLPALGDTAFLKALPLPTADAKLLLALAARWSEGNPLSLGFEDYPVWRARFGATEAPARRSPVTVFIGPHDALDEVAVLSSLQSLLAQTHKFWRVLVWTPAGRNRKEILKDPRIESVLPARWPAAVRAAVRKATWVSFLPAGDRWAPSCLAKAMSALRESPSHALCYTDTDAEPPQLPWFKPDWCYETFLSLPLLDHGFVCRAALLKDPSPQPLDWPWQAVAAAGGPAASVVHLAEALHACGDGRSPSAHRLEATGDRAGRPDIRSLVATDSTIARWTPGVGGLPHRVEWRAPRKWPAVTLMIPTRDRHDLLQTCMESLKQTDYPGLEICVIDNQSTCSQTLGYLRKLEGQGVKVLRWPHRFNYAAIHNHAVAALETPLIGFINNDVRALDALWLKALLRPLLREGVGATGAKLLWPNGMVQHGGVVAGLHGLVGHTGNLWAADDTGYHHLNQITRNVSAVTAACLLMRRSDYLAVGGMDAESFPVNFNDVDLCFKLRARGQRILWVADAVLEHAESVSRGLDLAPSKRARADRESENLELRWHNLLARDPFYNPNLNLDRYSHNGLAVPPRR